MADNWWESDPVAVADSTSQSVQDTGDWWKNDPVATAPQSEAYRPAGGYAEQGIHTRLMAGTPATDTELIPSKAFEYVNPLYWATRGQTEGVGGAIQGLQQGAAEAMSGFTSPMNLGLLATGGMAPRLIAGYFLGKQIYGTPEQWQALKDAPSLVDKFRIGSQMAAGFALPALGFKAHAELTQPVARTGFPEAPIENPRIPQQIQADLSVPNAEADLGAARSGNALGAEPAPETQVPQQPLPSQVPEAAVQPRADQIPPQTQPEIAQGAEQVNGIPESRTEPVPGTVGENVQPESGPPLVRERWQVSGPETTGEPPAEPVQAGAEPAQEPLLSRIANRYVADRIGAGEVGDVAQGEGVNTPEVLQRGLKMSPEEVNQHVSDLMNDAGGDPINQAAAVRAEEARLSDRSVELSRLSEANPTDLAVKQAADNAFKDLTDFHNGPVAKLKTRFHATGMALQAEVPVDLTTYNGIREAWLKENGKVPPPRIEPTLRRTAENVRRGIGEEQAAVRRISNEIANGKTKLTPESIRDSIIERMKDEPCRV